MSLPISSPVPRFADLTLALAHWAAEQPDADACIFLGAENCVQERLTYAQLDRAASWLAGELARHAEPGDRVLLMFQTGLSFVAGFFAAHKAGLVPVPVVPPRGERLREASMGIVKDCRPRIVLSSREQVERLLAGDELRDVVPLVLEFEDLRRAADSCAGGARPDVGGGPSALAFLQYTSGSTSAPKGVCVSQRNLFANLEMQRLALANPWGARYVGWAPLYHDMGLIANVLEPFYLGGLSVLMSPQQMAQSPWLWLRAISDYGARTSGGSNYAFELCVARAERILRDAPDLSCWKVAFNSAEPVRAGTVRRFCERFAPLGFEPQAMVPCYGLAEATLMVSGNAGGNPPVIHDLGKSALQAGRCESPRGQGDACEVVGCGLPVPGCTIRIVDPARGVALPEGDVGEIWVHGPHIPERYWNRDELSPESFHARLADASDPRRYLRTGDLGSLLGGELIVTGRLKDVLIIRGRNVYPQDVEHVAERACEGLRPGGAAAFLAEDGGDGPRTAVVLEVEREWRRRIDVAAAARQVRKSVMNEFDVMLHHVCFVEPGSVPKTSSGKVRRAETRRRWLQQELALLAPGARTRPNDSTTTGNFA